jgi:hypothetical protein
MLCHSLLLSLFPQVPSSTSTITNMLYIWVCIWSCLFLCICLSLGFIFHIWEKTCNLCLSEPGLLHLTWCPRRISVRGQPRKIVSETPITTNKSSMVVHNP